MIPANTPATDNRAKTIGSNTELPRPAMNMSAVDDT
jgi:hypothetical protein